MNSFLFVAPFVFFLPLPLLQEKPGQDALRAAIEINGGAKLTSDRMVTLKFAKPAPDAPIVEMSLSPDGNTWAPWRPFTEVTKYELSEGPGEKSVYARFSDQKGNVSSVAVARIVLDPNAPPMEPEVEAPSSRPETFFARFKTGLWIEGPVFKSRTVAGSRKLTSEVMATLDLAVGMSLSDSFTLEIFGEEALGGDATVASAGLAAGLKVYEGPFILGNALLEIRMAAFASDLKVDTGGFGDFDLGFGFQAGLGASWNLSEHLWIDAEAGFRGAFYSWSGPSVVDGDEHAHSLGAELMLGISYRF